MEIFKFSKCQFPNFPFPSFQFSSFELIKCPVFKFSSSKLPNFLFQFSNLSVFTFSISSSIFSIPKCPIFKFRIFKFQNFKKFGTYTFQHFQNFRLSDMKKYYFQGCSHIVFVFLKYFGDKYGVRGSSFGRFLEVPEIIQKVLQYLRESKLAICE